MAYATQFNDYDNSYLNEQDDIYHPLDYLQEKQISEEQVNVFIITTAVVALLYALIQSETGRFARSLGISREVCFVFCNPAFPFLHNCDSFCPVDGGLTEFSGSCSVTCGSGILTETRSCTNPAPRNGGKGCSGTLRRSSQCNNGACPIPACPVTSQLVCTSDGTTPILRPDSIQPLGSDGSLPECINFCRNDDMARVAALFSLVNGDCSCWNTCILGSPPPSVTLEPYQLATPIRGCI